jgi:hypothetical protein
LQAVISAFDIADRVVRKTTNAEGKERISDEMNWYDRRFFGPAPHIVAAAEFILDSPAEARRPDCAQMRASHEPVAAARSRSTGWFGFPMMTTNALLGGVIAYNLRFRLDIEAVINGITVLLLFVGVP